MRVAKFPHPSPLPGRSYWAIWEWEDPLAESPLAVFHFGDGNLIVEQPLGPVELTCLLDWLREVLPALEWPQITLAMTLTAAVFAPLPVEYTIPPPPPPPPKKRKRSAQPTLARFLKKRLTSGKHRR